MKKFIAAILSAAVLMGLTGCGSPQQPEEKPNRVSTADIDPAVIGTWSNGTIGYRFGEDRKVALVIDQSDYVHFNGEDLIVSDQTLTKDTIEFNGIDFRAYYAYESEDTGETSELDILLMTRLGEPNRNSYDGLYKITGGVVQESVGEGLAGTLSKTLDEMDIQAEIEGDKFTAIINDYCSYETVNGNIELFDEHINYADPNADCIRYVYSVDGDTLTMTYSSNQGISTTHEEFKRVK